MSEAIVSKNTYVLVWSVLLILLGVTVAVSYVHLGWFNPVVALAIAGIKASVIILYFMHVRYSPKLIWLVLGAALLWLAIIMVGTMGDYLTRVYMPRPAVWGK